MKEDYKDCLFYSLDENNFFNQLEKIKIIKI